MESNVQKIQKALDKIIVITTEWQGSIPFGEVRKIAKAARKLPLRNGDIGTPEEQAERMFRFCIHHGCCDNCPADGENGHIGCVLRWAAMPYAPDTKKEGEQR